MHAWTPMLIACVLAATAPEAPGVTAPRDWCGTPAEPAPVDGALSLEARAQAPCPGYGACDEPLVRDTTTVSPLRLRVLAHIVRSADGSCDLAEADVRAAIDGLNAVYAATGTGVQFVLTGVRVHVDDELAWVPPCDSTSRCGTAQQAILRTRSAYSESPETQCNLFFSCLRTSAWGGWSGLGTFPWSANALRPTGGIWMNSLALAAKPHLAPHEMGHVLGLYHTFRGVSEVAGCADPCYEPVQAGDRDRVGDRASDTPATPLNYTCLGPPGADCTGTSWGATQPENYMSYASPWCVDRFTPQQVRRMQCWARARLGGWSVDAPPAAPALALRVWPNPARDRVDVSFAVERATAAELEVFDLLGRRVDRRRVEAGAPGSQHVRWDGIGADGATLPPGVYCARVRAGGAEGHVRFAWRP